MNTINSTSSAAAYPTGRAIGSPTQAYSQAHAAQHNIYNNSSSSSSAMMQPAHAQQQQQQLAAPNSMLYSTTTGNAGRSSSSTVVVGKEQAIPTTTTSTVLNLPVLPPVAGDEVVAAMTALDALCGDYWSLPPHHALVLTKALVNEALEAPSVKARVSALLYLLLIGVKAACCYQAKCGEYQHPGIDSCVDVDNCRCSLYSVSILVCIFQHLNI
jgi:hypothetical protein